MSIMCFPDKKWSAIIPPSSKTQCSTVHRGFVTRAPGYWFLLIVSAFFVCGLWKTGSVGRWGSSMRAKALIHFDLSIPSSSSTLSSSLSSSSTSSSSTPRRLALDRSNARPSPDAARRKHRGILSRYMLQLYHRRPDADVVRAIQPVHTSGPLSDGGRILEFAIPSVDVDETLEAAELLGIAGAIIRVRSLNDLPTMNTSEEIRRSRKDDAWRAFDVTSLVAGRNGGDVVKLYVHGRSTYRPYGDSPILLLNYSKTRNVQSRYRRSAEEQEDQDRWKDEAPRRRRRNSCHRRSMYVDFALIAYDEWIVAPPGYEAYQCSGKCFFPLGDHLSPTKHAIVQTLMHGAFQASENLAGSKFVGRACCVPTRLAPTSLLYLDARGTLTYEYGYEDMVVSECGCR
ncbi:inhibin beta A chain-like isoform X1 [Pogonomyrmex barbatus]|uniref:Inhibin beta A chain-like isoform X1 n=1 Tax=Pogonomyrmex barbatus TaxID=144034 RepID=A0A6I9VX38_9HYME|nr:inhibin beta A chain-like isoform X1 [Pogonomyrmex barbatus]